MVKSIFPITYNEAAVDEKNELLSLSKPFIESLCSQISKTDDTWISILNDEVGYYCLKVTDVNNDTVCLNGTGNRFNILVL